MVGISDQEVVVRLAVAAALGMAIGLERERLEQPAGLRDHALVAVGASLIMIISAYGFQHVTGAPNVVLDPSRIAAQVVTGIGFLGAGTIVLQHNVVRGLTTAASIWAAAALGLAAGGGLYFASFVAAALLLVILAGIKSLERRFSRRYGRTALTLLVQRSAFALKDLHAVVLDAGVRIDRLDIRDAKDAPAHDRVDLLVATVDSARMVGLIDALRAKTGIDAVRSTVVLQRR